jgi:2-phosphosulfolactate phosphatase
MRVHVALTPTDAGACGLHGRAAIVVDVLRATTSVVAACAAGCRRIVPVVDDAAAKAAATGFAREEVVLAGERGGEPIAGFDLGNSPLEFTAARVGGRTIILTTTNGTAAMRAANHAGAGAAAALTNAGAAAGWALAQRRDVTVLCSGDDGALSLEDAVCAGIIVGRMVATTPDLELSDGARMAWRLGQYYEERLDLVGRHSRWARRLAAKGRAADVQACLQLDTTWLVPVIEAEGIVPGRGQAGAATPGVDGRGPEAAP